jgi:hypothetical protein
MPRDSCASRAIHQGRRGRGGGSYTCQVISEFNKGLGSWLDMQVLTGDLRSSEFARQAVLGSDGIVCCLGTTAFPSLRFISLIEALRGTTQSQISEGCNGGGTKGGGVVIRSVEVIDAAPALYVYRHCSKQMATFWLNRLHCSCSMVFFVACYSQCKEHGNF